MIYDHDDDENEDMFRATRHTPPDWQTTEAEEAFCDLPLFDSLWERSQHFVKMSAAAALNTLNQDRDADELFDENSIVLGEVGREESLSQMLERMRKIEISRLTGGLIND